jgi:heat-inducible transcriptional repressor
MKDRTQNLLKLVVENYIATAEPVGSRFLTESAGLEVSAATVRNELAMLEEEGYLTHPHTSAGRVPTETGYQYYVEHLMEQKSLKKKIKDEITNFSKHEDKKQGMKQVAKMVATEANNAVIIAFGPHSVYYTGISNLFSQPEFHEVGHTVSVSAMFDAVEEYIDDLFEKLERTSTILIGSKNPFGSTCSLVGSLIGEKSAFAVLGPVRMDYSDTIPLVSFISTLEV